MIIYRVERFFDCRKKQTAHIYEPFAMLVLSGQAESDRHTTRAHTHHCALVFPYSRSVTLLAFRHSSCLNCRPSFTSFVGAARYCYAALPRSTLGRCFTPDCINKTAHEDSFIYTVGLPGVEPGKSSVPGNSFWLSGYRESDPASYAPHAHVLPLHYTPTVKTKILYFLEFPLK